MCGGGPALRHSDADSRALLLHVPLLRQLRWRDAPAPEEECRLPARPAGNAALLHLTGHHVSATHAQMTHTNGICGTFWCRHAACACVHILGL